MQATDGANAALRFAKPSWFPTVAQTLVLICPSCLSCILVSLARRDAPSFVFQNAEGPGTISVHRPLLVDPWILDLLRAGCPPIEGQGTGDILLAARLRTKMGGDVRARRARRLFHLMHCGFAQHWLFLRALGLKASY